MDKTLKVFIGYDHRQPIGYHVLAHSILSNTSKPISLIPLILPTLPITRFGLTPFTYSRFLVPYLCNYQGNALFLDIDILVNCDIAELFDLYDSNFTVQVSKNQKKFEWSSVMLFNCEKCKILTPEFVQTAKELHDFSFLKVDEIGEIPGEFNHLVGYDELNPTAKIIHFTQGLPCFEETQESEFAREWMDTYGALSSSIPWAELMGHSVHAKKSKDGSRMVPKFFKES